MGKKSAINYIKALLSNGRVETEDDFRGRFLECSGGGIGVRLRLCFRVRICGSKANYRLALGETPSIDRLRISSKQIEGSVSP